MRIHDEQLSFELIELYKNKNCKYCYGRGYFVSDNGKGTARYGDYCICVKKNLKKVSE